MPIYAPPFVYGDSAGVLGDHVTAENQDILVQFGNPPFTLADFLVGDAHELTDHARGGEDTLQSQGGLNQALAVGDAETMTGHARGGDDGLVSALARGSALAFGDALRMGDHSVGGNDVVTADSRFHSIGFGEADLMTDHARGGDDTVMTSSDAVLFSTMYGDADTMRGHAQGGNDVLQPLSPTNTAALAMYGDARVTADFAAGGNDTLISGRGADTMWGDSAEHGTHTRTGADVFEFSPPNAHDQIMDFEPGKDRIELKGFGFTSFQDVAGHIQDDAQGALISFDATDSVLVVGVHQLGAGDFLFA